jgi:hypothetical protein
MTIDQKVRALLRKTVAAGCTPAEQESATALARTIVKKHGLTAADFTWPAPPPKPKKAAKAPSRAPKATKPGKGAAKPATKPVRRADQVLAMLRRKDGVSIAELMEAFGVLPHSARAMISVYSRAAGVRAELREGRYRATA